MTQQKKQIIITAVITFVVAGLIGFYTGRYYEIQNRRRIMQRNFTGGQFYRQFQGGQSGPGGMQPGFEQRRFRD